MMVSAFRFLPALAVFLVGGGQNWIFPSVAGVEKEPDGIPGIEFLGLGYDIVTGNPRGTSTSELDPGFRHRILDLISDGGKTTLDGQYALPDQVESIAAASCKFDSKSVELSDEESYRKELSKEATQDVSVSASGSYGPVEASGSVAYSKSEKFQEFKETNVNTQSTVFEAKAICTEFDLRLEPYADPSFKTSFKTALDALPKEFNECNQTNRNMFYQFIDTFGTHVVTEVVLGAKYILSTEIRAKDVMELQKQSVDVASSLSIELAVSIKKAKDPSPDPPSTGGDEGNVYRVVFENYPGGNVSEPNSAPAPAPEPASPSGGGGSSFGGGSVQFSYGQSSSTSTSQETAKKISEKSSRVTEITIGGRPPQDQNWVDWAASVPERPMPIKLKLKGIFEYMDEDQGKVFMQAVFAKYGLVLGENEVLSDVIKATHFGVFTLNAIPISSYSNTAISNYRTLMSTNFPTIAKADGGTTDKQKILLVPDDTTRQQDEGDYTSWRATANCPTGSYVCGVATIFDVCSEYFLGPDDDLGITMIDLHCCTKEGDSASVKYTDLFVENRYNKPDGCLFRSNNKHCPDGSWVVGFEGRAYSYMDGASTDPEGVNGLRIFCSNNRNDAILVEGGGDDGEWKGAKYAPEGFLFKGARVLSDGESGQIPNELGIANIEFFYERVSFSTSVSTSFYSYEAIWDGSKAVVSAYFATPIQGVLAPSSVEEQKFVTTTKHGAYLRSGISNFFGFMSSTDPSTARFGLRIFDTSVYSSKDMENFSFLSADNLEKNPQITAGVVHPDGFTLSKLFGFDEGFELREGSQDGRFIQITFSNSESCNLNDIPTVALFPILFSESGTLPNSVPEYALFLKNEYWKGSKLIPACSNGKGETAMVVGPSLGGSFGFSFLRISRSVNVKGMLHGYISTADATNCPEMTRTIPGLSYCKEVLNSRSLVRFFFDEPFEDVPSVIVTPVAPTSHNPDTSPKAAALTVVMDITRSSTTVYSDYFDDISKDYGVAASFTVIITGPPKLSTSVAIKTECPNFLVAH